MNDILRPELLWIEGRCYRVNDPNVEVTALQEHDLYENEIVFEDMDDDGEDEDCEVTMIDDSRYRTSLHVSKHYVGSIIGKKGANKMRIERDTKTEIKIPKQGQTGDIVIFGPSPSSVKAARRRINIIVISSRMKQKSTHFISIRMDSPEIISNFEEFKRSVLRECPDRGIDESLFIRSNKLHLTLGMMCLMDNEERLQASKLLTEAKQNIIMPMLENYLPLKLRLKGLQYMNDDPREIDVLYGCVQEEDAPSGILQQVVDAIVEHFYKAGFEDVPIGILQQVVDAIVEHFYKAGFMEKEFGRDNVKLHVTLINSKYRSRESSTNIAKEKNEEPQSRDRRPRVTFDGSRVLEKFADYDFGVAEVTEIHLSQRHSMGADGYYQPTCVISCRRS
ncbi:AKAP7 2'5' RNA ligase-like domain-containing protein [Phthorimaea operculella]|nr:AKAP7 2'5' RNA ligase-like domain-containing protein [Phthorimaea operculella]